MEIDHVIYEIKSEKFCGTRKYTALSSLSYEVSEVVFSEMLPRFPSSKIHGLYGPSDRVELELNGAKSRHDIFHIFG